MDRVTLKRPIGFQHKSVEDKFDDKRAARTKGLHSPMTPLRRGRKTLFCHTRNMAA